jgi:hypothetical protein
MEKTEELNKVELVGKQNWQDAISQLNEKEHQLIEVRKEYQRFRKVLKEATERDKQCSANNEAIIESSLNKSRESVGRSSEFASTDKKSLQKSANSLIHVPRRLSMNQRLGSANFFAQDEVDQL